jgi:hypothetical protein
MTQTLNKGAPLDVAFINDLVTTVERLVADSNSSQYKRTTVKNPVFQRTSSATTVRTADARIQAETVLAGNTGGGQVPQAGDKLTFTVSLTNFASEPVVTATPIMINASAKKPPLSAVITSITPANVSGYIHVHDTFAANQQAAVSVVAIGIPSNSTGTATTNIQSNGTLIGS